MIDFKQIVSKTSVKINILKIFSTEKFFTFQPG